MSTVVADYNNKNIKFYRNGIQFGSTIYVVGGMFYPIANVSKSIGSYFNQSDYLNGFIDDVRIYNRALSALEISQIYNATKSKYGY